MTVVQWLDVGARCLVVGAWGVLSACGDGGGGAGEGSGGTGAQENSGGNAGSSASGGGASGSGSGAGSGGASAQGGSGGSGSGSGGSSAQGGSGSGGTAAQASPDAEACASMAVEFPEPGAAEYVQWNLDGAEKTALPTPGGAYFFNGFLNLTTYAADFSGSVSIGVTRSRSRCRLERTGATRATRRPASRPTA